MIFWNNKNIKAPLSNNQNQSLPVIDLSISYGIVNSVVINEDDGSEIFMVQPGYRFVTWDVVGEPSVQEAVMSVMESKGQKSMIPTRSIVRKAAPDIALVNEIGIWLASER